MKAEVEAEFLLLLERRQQMEQREKSLFFLSPHFLLPANQFPLESLQVAKKLQQRSHLIIVLSVLFILSFLDGYFHFLGPQAGWFSISAPLW